MRHHEQRATQDLNTITETVATMAEQVETVLTDAVHALLTNNQQLAHATVLADHPINRKMRKIDRLCHAYIATHLPSVRPLRLISSIIRINIELERIGDYAVIICREGLTLSSPPSGLLGGELETIASESGKMLHQAIESFNQRNAERAKATIGMSQHMEHALNNVYENLIDEDNDLKINHKDRYALFVVFNMLKRVADQAKNICEETIFAITGETKAKKIYKLLFLDTDNHCLAPMAAAIANQQFPNSATYDCACQCQADELHPALEAFMHQRDVTTELPAPKSLELSAKEQSDYHVIISLQGNVSDYIDNPPFHTVLQQWDLTPIASHLDEQQTESAMKEAYRALSLQIRDLIEILHGKEAD